MKNSDDALLAGLLSARERELLEVLRGGASVQEMSDQFMISTGAIATHVERILEKLEAESQLQATFFGRRLAKRIRDELSAPFEWDD